MNQKGFTVNHFTVKPFSIRLFIYSTSKSEAMVGFFFHPAIFSINTKSTGTTKIAKEVADNIPPNTVQPMVLRDSAAAPLANAKGKTPRMKAREVIIIGRKRNCTASKVAGTKSIPLSTRSLANSTIKIAFLLPNQSR